MRIRIMEPRAASIEGVDLSTFHAGQVYEVDPTVATYLIVSGVAEPCTDGSPALVVSSSEVIVGVFTGRRTISDVVDDWEEDPEPAA